MSGWFWCFICLAVLAAIITCLALLAPKVVKIVDEEVSTKRIKILAITIGWFIALVCLCFASTTVVSTRNIGVVTTFGRPTGQQLSNGLHFKAPWSKVTELDGAIQIENQTGKDKGTQVRLGNNSIATVENSVQWRIRPEAADQLFLDYRTFENIRDNLVIRQVNSALNDVLAKYNPLTSLQDGQNAGNNDDLAKQVLELLKQRTGAQIEFKQVIIPVIHFDADTQKKIDSFNAAIANTRIAEQNQRTAAAEAEANRILSQSVSNDPNVLVSKCLDIVSKNGGSPAGCWPGTGVIVNGSK